MNDDASMTAGGAPVRAQEGQIDVLANNAGTVLTSMFEKAEPDDTGLSRKAKEELPNLDS